ncbi:hypothetical protein [Crocosphaera sp. Alani8]|uniref:hypothetical protein n=1 Tax=Crocosphaera sp. Alani8 TaxID=3038952 RepID=UPI00313CE293
MLDKYYLIILLIMLCKYLLGVSAILLLLPSPSQAFPTDYQISEAAQRICNTPRNSSESLESLFMRSMGKWLYNQTLSVEEAKNEEKITYLYGLVVQKAFDNCPVRTYEIANNYQFAIPETLNK